MWKRLHCSTRSSGSSIRTNGTTDEDSVLQFFVGSIVSLIFIILLKLNSKVMTGFHKSIDFLLFFSQFQVILVTCVGLSIYNKRVQTILSKSLLQVVASIYWQCLFLDTWCCRHTSGCSHDASSHCRFERHLSSYAAKQLFKSVLHLLYSSDCGWS